MFQLLVLLTFEVELAKCPKWHLDAIHALNPVSIELFGIVRD